MTAWRIAAAGGYEAVPKAEQERLEAQQARLALRRLDEAMAFHPTNADLWIERGSIELNKLHDPLAAAESYRRAWEQPGAPYYAARLHAEMLKRAGRKAEALAWLVRLHPQLPAAEEVAGADIVMGRIRDLEREVGVPPERVYRPAR
jgi:Tfp pilus assembly protein PilF